MGGTWDIKKIVADGQGRGILKEKSRQMTRQQHEEKKRLKRLKKRRR